MKRESGILLHVSSLPTKYGVGTLGKEAFDFLDFLKQAGQTYWQILPLVFFIVPNIDTHSKKPNYNNIQSAPSQQYIDSVPPITPDTMKNLK